MNTLKAEKRDLSIKAKKLRREGLVTGNLFGHELETSIPLQLEKGVIDQLLKHEGKGGRVMLEVEGQTYNALIKEVDYDSLKRCVNEIDFQALVSNEKVHSTAEIHLINLEKLSAGIPQQMLHEISFKALPAALVDRVEIDAGNLKVGDTVKVKDLPIAQKEDVSLTTDLETTVVIVTEAHASAVVETEAAEKEEDKAEE
ncbi:50S ribosomal protein L25 [Sporofaciens musculi]|uniref:50S ribosomal protein L25 n=1 Tax=Sporofaciens musculi TaxID=2681861 RepID=UPI002570CBA6|nr:50S ribosomal protein L25 [Sporofaciens musculi]